MLWSVLVICMVKSIFKAPPLEFLKILVRNLAQGPSEYLRLGMMVYPLPGFLGVFGYFADGEVVEY